MSEQGELWSADPDGWARDAESRLLPLYEAVLERLAPAPLDDAVGAQLPAGPVVDICRQVGADQVRRVLREFFGPRVQADGSVVMGAVFRCVVARPRG